MNRIIERLEKEQLRKNVPELSIGSTVKVTLKIEEEGKERIQHFSGILISKKGSAIRSTITLRRISGHTNIEKIFYIHSPLITSIEVIRLGKVRQAKLYYLREKIGKKAKIKSRS